MVNFNWNYMVILNWNWVLTLNWNWVVNITGICTQGVSFEELTTVNTLLQKDHLDQEQKQTTTDIVQRLQGTELFSLLEDSIEGASQKIAKLLDNTLLPQSRKNQSAAPNNSSGDFNIEEYI